MGKEDLIKTITNTIKYSLAVLFGIYIVLYIVYLIWIKGVNSNNIYGLGGVIIISIIILLNAMKYLSSGESKFLWRIMFNLVIFFFIMLVYINFKSIEECRNCLDDEEKTSYLVYSLIILSIYLYLYKERSLADCSYLNFSKIIIILSMILSFIHTMRQTFAVCLFLLFYMYS
jgi:hypothetical protein